MQGYFDRDWSCSRCGYNLRGLSFADPCPSCGHREKYLPSSSKVKGYSKWLKEKIEDPPFHAGALTSLACALAGGVFAIAGAFLESLQFASFPKIAFGPLTLAIVVAPSIEETLKISITSFVVERKPYLFSKASQVFISCIGAAALFAAVENLIYLNVYIDNPSEQIKLWRWTVCISLHVTCTAIAATGLLRVWRRTVSELRPPSFGPVSKSLIAAAVVHGTYNFLVFLYEALTT